MYHNMVFGYDYCRWQNQGWYQHVPPPSVILMAMAVRRSNTDGIAWCGMSRATLEATGHRHRATTCSALPQRPPGQQAKKQQSTNTPKKLDVLMAMAMHQYVAAHTAQWRRFRALLEATKRHHWASIAANRCNQSRMCQFFSSFFIINSYIKVAGRVEGLCFQ